MHAPVPADPAELKQKKLSIVEKDDIPYLILKKSE